MSTSRGRLRRGSVLAAVALLFVGGQLLAAGPAAAHDVLEETNPKDGSTVGVTPSEVTLTFDQVAFAVGSQVLVKGPSGNVAVGPVRIVDRVVHEAIQPGAPAGPYSVEWRVTSADGHPVSGKFSFTSQAAAAGTPSSPGTSTTSPTATAGQGASNNWVLPVLILAVIWLAIVVLLMRHRRLAPPPKRPSARRRRGQPRGPGEP